MSMNLPINVPWKLLAASPDMMDTNFGNKDFPFTWRSSLAISAFEPKQEDLPEAYCEDRVTYLKITCNITGYQSSPGEIAEGKKSFPDVPTEELERIFGEYFACYGVLLNVAVFPHKKELKPLTIDFGKQSPGTELPNPYQSDQAQFDNYVILMPDPPIGNEVLTASNQIVDYYPTSPDQKGELFSPDKVIVKFPSSPKIQAKVVIFSSSRPIALTMYAYNDGGLVGQKTGQDLNQVYDFTIEGDGINQAIIKFDADLSTIVEQEASFLLLEFSYYALQDVPVDLKDYPHIVDFEPKTRDLYQSSTEEGELITGSQSKVNLTKSYSHTDSTQWGIDAKKEVSGGIGQQGAGISSSLSGGLTHTWGETDQDTTTTQADSSRERRERHAATTNISQMYNLLTGYHVGTNRAVFLMLPRPHTLQPTDLRSFVRGLRIIEGIQEFFLIVARPKDINFLSIEAFLQTGHFSEEVAERGPEYDLSHEDFEVQKWAFENMIEAHFASTYTVKEGYVVDTNPDRNDNADPRHPASFPPPYKPDPYHRGVAEISNEIIVLRHDHKDQVQKYAPVQKDPRTNLTYPVYVHEGIGLLDYSYRAENMVTVKVEGVAHSVGGNSFGSVLGKYRVFTRSQNPLPRNVNDPLLITSRRLCCSFESSDGSLKIIPMTYDEMGDFGISIAGEPAIVTNRELLKPIKQLPSIKHLFEKHLQKFNGGGGINDSGNLESEITSALGGEIHLPAVKELLGKIQFEMVTNTMSPNSYPFGHVRFIDTDYFKNHIIRLMPQPLLEKPVRSLSGLSNEVVTAIGKRTVGEALKLNLNSFANVTGLSIKDAAKTRRELLKIKTTLSEAQKTIVGDNEPANDSVKRY